MSATEPGESILASRMAPPSGGPLSVSVSVHDSTRLEWSVVVPLRAQRQRYRLEAMLTFPSHVFAPHSPWLQLQSFARLKIPSRAREGIAGTVADVQREALGATREPLPFQARGCFAKAAGEPVEVAHAADGRLVKHLDGVLPAWSRRSTWWRRRRVAGSAPARVARKAARSSP